MKIEFQDKSYISLDKNENKIIVSIGAISPDNPLALIVNAVELTEEEFKKIIKNILKE